MSSITEQYIKVNGPRRDSAMVVVFRSGKMVASTKATGRMIWQMAEEDSFIQTAMSMKENGLTIRHTGGGHMFTWTALNTQVSGERTNSMDSVSKHGQMVPNMRAITSTAKNTALELSSGLMVPCTLENSTTITSMERVCTHGPMDVSMKANGAKIGRAHV